VIPRHIQIAVGMLLVAVFTLGFYVLTLRREALSGARASDRPIAPPVAGKTEKVALFVAYDDDRVIRREEFSVALPQERSARVRQVIRALLDHYTAIPSPHPMAESADVKDVYLLDQDRVVVDLTAAFADQHRSGILVESLTVTSIIQSLAANVPEVKQVKFLIDGRERETLAGHADLMSFYDVASVRELVKGLE
jgi:hypothetical protein